MIDLIPDDAGTCEVSAIQFLGFDQLVQVTMPNGNTPLTCRTRSRIDLKPGLHVRVHVSGRVLCYPLP
jgi:hypothetical protein